MKFSYLLLKQLVPAIKTKDELIEKLNLYAFEAENVNGNSIDVKLPPNRFSDAAGHWGLAREISAIYGRKSQIPNPKLQTNSKFKNLNSKFNVEIQDKNLCSRYAGRYFENVKVGQSPKWMQKILIDCGMRPINNVVDIMNYVMLETGQPLHAFDFDKIKGANQKSKILNSKQIQNHKSEILNIVARKAKKDESITTLDNQEIKLNENVLVIAQNSAILAIAGIKGGKKAEVDKNTKRIIVEAANFDATSVYKTSRFLGLTTDASLRFSRGLSQELVALGLNRAAELLKKECGAKAGEIIDVNFNKPSRKIVRFDVKKFADFIGLELDFVKISKYLNRFGFKVIQDSEFPAQKQVLYGAGKIQNSFLVEIPPLRQDIETFEDLCEEVVRLYGYNNLQSKAPAVALRPSEFEDQIILKDKIRKVLASLGLSEVQSNSFISQKDAETYKHPDLMELENPISAEYQYLRPCLAINFLKNIESNGRFFDEVNLFEIGNIFFRKDKTIKEVPALGIVSASKKSETFFRLKGIVSALFKKIGAMDFFFAPAGYDNWIKTAAGGYLDLDNVLKVEVNSGSIIGYLGKLKIPAGLKGWHLSVFEIDLQKLIDYIEEEYEYLPIPKYPAVIRDISIWIDKTARSGDIIQTISESNLKLIEDVDLVDEYESDNRRSLAFRIIFQAEDRTLTDAEVNKMMEEIVVELKNKFKAEIR